MCLESPWASLWRNVVSLRDNLGEWGEADSRPFTHKDRVEKSCCLLNMAGCLIKSLIKSGDSAAKTIFKEGKEEQAARRLLSLVLLSFCVHVLLGQQVVHFLGAKSFCPRAWTSHCNSCLRFWASVSHSVKWRQELLEFNL